LLALRLKVEGGFQISDLAWLLLTARLVLTSNFWALPSLPVMGRYFLWAEEARVAGIMPGLKMLCDSFLV